MADYEEIAHLVFPNQIGNHDEQDEITLKIPLLSPATNLPERDSFGSKEKKAQEDDAHKLRRMRITALYTGCVADVVLRATAMVLALISVVLTAVNRVGYSSIPFSDSYLKLFLSGYLLSVNILVFVYSLLLLRFTISQMISCNVRNLSNLSFLLSIFQLDQTFAYLLISTSSNAFGCIGNLALCNGQPHKNGFCQRALASAIVSLLAFFVMSGASIISGIRLATKIRNCSHDFELTLCYLLDDGPPSKDCNCPASKLLP